MYQIPEELQRELDAFYLPFGGRLNPQNRWVALTAIIPWEEIERRYARQFSSRLGAPAKRSRLALGSLIIKQRMKISDEETVEQIRENPYLQFFLGFEGYTDETPFDSSMMVYFRKRFGSKTLAQINELIIEQQRESSGDDDKPESKPKSGQAEEPANRGQLLLDASCVPQDIRHPTDIGVLNDAREATERVIDVLHAEREGGQKKPRTYRQNARRDYLNCVKNKRLSLKGFYKGRKQQLQYIARNLRTINKLTAEVGLSALSARVYRSLLIASEVYRQQKQMHESKEHRVEGRIVSLAQPHVRPIVRGKAGKRVEFGAKISVSVVDGFTYIDRISWDAYNEGGDLPDQIESYKKRFGRYPESVHADKIYRTRENRRFCSKRGIRISGPRLGRPPADEQIQKAVKRQQREDERKRVEVEGKLGEGKRVYGLDRVPAKRADTSETTIMMAVLAMNLSKILRDLFVRLIEIAYPAILSDRFPLAAAAYV